MVVDLALVASKFAARLRAEGLPVGPQRSARFASAVTLAEPSTVRELYWCGMATLVADPAEFPTYDRVFALVFGGMADPAESRGDPNAPPLPRQSPPRDPPSTSDGSRVTPSLSGTTMAGPTSQQPDESDPDNPYPALAATAERLGGPEFASLSPAGPARMNPGRGPLRPRPPPPPPRGCP